MGNKVAPFAATPDPTFGRNEPAPNQESKRASAPASPAGDPADLRLIIEEDKSSGTYIYKTVNRRTGEVVRQLPREEILKLRDEPEYIAGIVVRTRA